MSEEMKPEVVETVKETLDVAQEASSEIVEEAAESAEKTVEETLEEKVEEVKEAVEEKVEEVKEAVEEKVEEVKEAAVNLGEKTLAELSGMFQELTESEDRMKRSKEAEALKSAFYKRLSREKAEAGEDATVDEPDADTEEEVATQPLESMAVSPFAAIEAGFKSLYLKYKKERAEYNRQLDAEREANLQKKLAIIEDLKLLVEEQGDMKDAFPKFREIQTRWRETGPVPQQNFRDVNDTYQLYVEKFYDLVQINRELRDLDFRKNLEAKTQFCEQAEALAESDDVVGAFKELQKLHEQWKEYGPVAKEYRDAIWERFRAATAVINKRYQAHFEGLKEQHAANLEALRPRVRHQHQPPAYGHHPDRWPSQSPSTQGTSAQHKSPSRYHND